MRKSKIAFINPQLHPSSKVTLFTDHLIGELETQLPDHYEIAYKPLNLFLNEPDHRSNLEHYAEELNESYESCFIHHDFSDAFHTSFGIIEAFFSKLTIPIITTFHCVRHNPKPEFYQELIQLAHRSDHVFVFTKKAKSLLSMVYGIEADKISTHSYGTQYYPFTDAAFFKKKRHIPTRNTSILTYGLNSDSKGIDLAFKALKEINLDTIHYSIAFDDLSSGAESILEEKINYHDLESTVSIIKISDKRNDLNTLFFSSDIFIMPYHNADTLYPDALPRALESKTAIISTKFWEAEDYIESTRGLFFEFNSYLSLKNRLLLLLKDPTLREQYQEDGFNYAKQLNWCNIAQIYHNVISEISYKKKLLSQYSHG